MKNSLRRLAFIAAAATLCASSAAFAATPTDSVSIPGPLRSFLRMAGISQEVTPDEVLPMLARNVFLHGYENNRPTEYLILVDRYVQLARELQSLAGPDGRLRVASCADAGPLVHALGYRFRHACSRADASLATEDPERAFLTIDSGFPITELEKSLEKGGEPFAYSFPATQVPVIFTQRDWLALNTQKSKRGGDLLDLLLHDCSVARLYSAMARLTPDARTNFAQSLGLRKLVLVSAAFDFYGSQVTIADGAVDVPGGAAAEKSWQEMVGASPRAQDEFLLRLMGRDRGWLAAYFDAISRVSPDRQAWLTQGDRLRRLYEAYRSTGINVHAASGVFPRNANLMLLFSRLRWTPDGQLEVPGSLQAWQDAFARDAHSYGFREWPRRVHSIRDSESLLEALVAATNLETMIGPEQAFLAISAIDGRRAAGSRLSESAVRQLAARFAVYDDWYPIFADFPQLDEASMAQFLKTADHISGISTIALRSNALGAFQADIGLWQILARQGQIPPDALNASWRGALDPFAKAESSLELFDAARASLVSTVKAAGGSANPTEDELVDLLAGPPQQDAAAQRAHDELAARMHSVLDDQRLASLDTLFGLYDGLGQMSHGAAIADSLLPLAESLREFEMPRPIFTGGERVAWSPLIYVNRHAELQVRTDLTRTLRTARTPAQFTAAQARLTPFLRDTLVGLNYAYYEPPGAQVLHNNPLFVRSHDFAIASVQGVENVWGQPEIIGIGATAGGGAYLMGSLAGLPYALALTEEDFIAPVKVQALIWRETVPQLLVSAVVPRWWGVSRGEMHAAALYQRAGEELMAASPSHPELRAKVAGILADRFTAERRRELEASLATPPNSEQPRAVMLPSDAFYLAAEFRRRFPGETAQYSPAGRELDDLASRNPNDASAMNIDRLSRDFGVPHPALTETDTCSLLDREPFPISGGYASRLFGESWESSNLYWARVADEMGYAPAALNVLVPELTRRMVANIFASYVDDWPALMRAVRQTGDELRQGKFTVQAVTGDRGGREMAKGGRSE